MDESEVSIGRAAQHLGVHSHYLRRLEWAGRIPRARRNLNGRVYSEADISLLRALGIGSHPRRLRSLEELARQ